MADAPRTPAATRRVSYRQARSHETRRALVRAAMQLWRTQGYARTTVADICRTAGVSKGLFYFYFPRKEDLLTELGVISVEQVAAHAAELTRGSYDLPSVLHQVIQAWYTAMLRNPRELIARAILEGYRFEQEELAVKGERAWADGFMFSELFDKASRDGKLPPGADLDRLSRLTQLIVSEGSRRWAASTTPKSDFVESIVHDLEVVVAGVSATAVPPVKRKPSQPKRRGDTGSTSKQ